MFAGQIKQYLRFSRLIRSLVWLPCHCIESPIGYVCTVHEYRIDKLREVKPCKDSDVAELDMQEASQSYTNQNTVLQCYSPCM